MQVLVPFDVREPNTRLSSVLNAGERRQFARTMLADVLTAVAAAGHEPRVLSTAPVDCESPVTVDERPLTPAVNDALAAADLPLAVVMADLALATPDAVSDLCETTDDVVIAPGIGGGTNALVVREPAFRVDYHGASCRDHARTAKAAGASLGIVDSYRLGVDVDRPADLREVLLHGTGSAPAWLRDAGFGLRTEEGEAVLTRDGEPVNLRY